MEWGEGDVKNGKNLDSFFFYRILMISLTGQLLLFGIKRTSIFQYTGTKYIGENK